MTLGNMNKISDKLLFLCSSAKKAHMQRQVGRWLKDYEEVTSEAYLQ